jgi:tripeptide aminopeptidase
MSSLLQRFCRYVRVETTANEASQTYPSSRGQSDLAAVLAEELRAFGLDASMDESSIVSALLPGNVEGAPTIAWLAHMDTSPEASGKEVDPQVVEAYAGGDLTLKSGRIIPACDLQGFQGKTLITTDGTTLLGADDKSGVAVIMTALERLLAQPQRARCPIRVIFTCDEEIGRGTDKLNLQAIDAVCAYTLDGEGQGLIENETFSADLALVKVTGRNIHPGLAYRKMCNAIRAAAKFVELLPPELSPERTCERQPFLHPYVIEGGVAEVTIRVLLRSFHTPDLAEMAQRLRLAAQSVMEAMPEATLEVEVKEQYRNMAEYLAKEPRAVGLAEQAYRKAGMEPTFKSIRGGTDGSRLSEMGLPTPNLSTGMHNFHCEQEFACLDEMETAVTVLLELATLWSEQSA